MDRILYNARIHTLDKSEPLASTLMISNGRFKRVESNKDLANDFTGISSQDMAGLVILPGLTDAHLHLQHFAMGLQKIDCETRTLDECLDRVARKALETIPGEWILGHGWNQNNWQEGFGNAGLLDRAAPSNPVYLTAKSLHAGWANSQALSISGINSTTVDPLNGRIVRDSRGEPNGILLESAMEIIQNIIPELDIDTLTHYMILAQTELLKLGLTSVHDFDKRLCYLTLQNMYEQNLLKLRVLKSIPEEDFSHAIDLGLRSGFGDDQLQLGSLKLFADGALGPHTAAMLKPYEDDPENKGILSLDSDQIYEIGKKAVSYGISLAVHAIGDKANNEVLQGYSRLRDFENENGLPPARHRIEHVQLLHPADTCKLADLDLIASMQPIHQPSDMEMAEKYWGDRNQYAYAWRTQLEHGAVLAFGSDAPVESPNPFLGIHAAVTRQTMDGSPAETGWYPEQRLSIEEALLGFTQGPAYAATMEDRVGKIKEGFLADLIVLEEDPFEIHFSELKDIKPVATMIAGEWVFEK